MPALRTRTPQASKIDYPTILNEAWAQHLAPRAKNAPTVISTFAGCGGSSLGYSMAGYRELLAVEWDNNAVETFKLNFNDVPVYHGDIAKLSVDECLRIAGVGVGEIDVFDGSPPCQGFSTAGKRVMDDPRNGLFREYVRLLRGLRPRVFVMENVSGMVKGKMKIVFAEIMRELKASGYRVSARLLNAMYFHVPQSRERMIFVGVREDLGIEPSHPKAESAPIGIKQSIPNISSIIHDARGNEGTKIFNVLCPINSIRKAGGGSNTRFELTFLDGSKRNFLTSELASLASYHSNFKFSGTRIDAWNRIGNSVPPLFMRAIAAHIRREILERAA